MVILELETTTSRMQVQNAGCLAMLPHKFSYHKIKKLNLCPTLFSKVDSINNIPNHFKNWPKHQLLFIIKCWSWNYEYMKIIYVNCRVKNYLKEDCRSCIRNLCHCEKKAWKKNSGLYRIQTLELCEWVWVCSALPIKLTSQLEQIVEELVN